MTRTGFEGTPIDELLLNERPRRALKNDDINTIEQLRRVSDAELMQMPNFGKKSLQEVKEELARWEKEDRVVWVPTVLPHPHDVDVLKELIKMNEYLSYIAALFSKATQ